MPVKAGRGTPTTTRPDEREGVVVAHRRTLLRVRDDAGDEHDLRIPHGSSACVAGDRVRFVHDGESADLLAMLPRRSLLARPVYRGRDRLLAANVDLIVAVVAPVPMLDEALLDRCLVVAAHCGIASMVVANKLDLLGQDHAGDERQRLADYARAGYRVLAVSAVTGAGIDALREALAGTTSVMVGASGVGKSRLTRLLTGDDSVRTGSLGAGMHGRHTTSAATLYPLLGGGFLVDSPGVRDFGVWRMLPRDIEHGFLEFAPHLGHCRFRNCQHLAEPGCALTQAVSQGEVSERRLRSYRNMLAAAESA